MNCQFEKEESMPEEMTFARFGAPTFVGLKTGSMFNYAYSDEQAMMDSVRQWNRRFAGIGIHVLPLRCDRGRTLLYLFRPKKLAEDFRNSETVRILRRYGYNPREPNKCIAQLLAKVREGKSFPHEVGLFLGYPPEDVRGFIDHRAEGFKCVGCWKVYGDEKAAKKTFEAYRKCTKSCCRLLESGCPIERIIVNI